MGITTLGWIVIGSYLDIFGKLDLCFNFLAHILAGIDWNFSMAHEHIFLANLIWWRDKLVALFNVKSRLV